MRKSSARVASTQEVKVSGADPLNLVGVIVPGTRVPAVNSNYILFRDGVPIRSGTVREEDALRRHVTGLFRRTPAG